MPCTELSIEQQQCLLKVARQSIEAGLDHSGPLELNPADYEHNLTQRGCCFVTLHLNGQLRGCIGSLEAYQPLVKDVGEHAHAAAFRDPRFLPLGADELPDTKISVSILSQPDPIQFQSEEDLLRALNPGVDGLILEEKNSSGYLLHKATYLPSVWEQLPSPKEFVQSLKQKAGLSPDYWSDQLSFLRYRTQSFSE